MSKSFSDSYKAAGVDVVAGYESVELIKKHVAKTQIKGVMSAIGGFGGLFELDTNEFKHPVLVSGTDGVGTKLKLAFIMDKHDTVGIDCVAMCVNDIVCSGAKPLIFLDYIAVGKNVPTKIEKIVSGVADGCVMAGCALIGGETAEMPGFYSVDEYDIAGFSVGAVDKEKIIDSSSQQAGDVLIGLASSGVHSNGYSLVRKVFEMTPESLKRTLPEYNGKTLGEVLLTPTKIYVKPILKLMEDVKVKSVCHVTGGGFYENIPRSLPAGCAAKIEKAAVKTLPVFALIAKAGGISEHDMFNTYNMGVGMTVTVAKEDADTALAVLRENGEDAYVIGEAVSGDEGVILA